MRLLLNIADSIVRILANYQRKRESIGRISDEAFWNAKDKKLIK